MTVGILSNIVSPHQMPLAKVLRDRLGKGFTYLYTERFDPAYLRKVGCDVREEPWCLDVAGKTDALVQFPDVLIVGNRDVGLMEARTARGYRTWYMSERWFKPPLGFLRVFVPPYFRMVRRFLKALKAPTMLLLPMGIHAARDFARVMGLFSGDFRCLFRGPKVAFESRPGGSVVPLKQAMAEGILPAEAIAFAKRHGFAQIPEAHWGKVKPTGHYAKMRLWGYFVAPGQGNPRERSKGPLRVLWVGRMLDWKRTCTLVEAVKGLPDVTLDLYGQGPEENRLKRLAGLCSRIQFHDVVPMTQVRGIMRAHDVYVLPSDGGEGWGAVVNEALEEGMTVIGTAEAGASATILPLERLYPAGDVTALRRILETLRPEAGKIGPWTAENAADPLITLAEEQL